MRRILKFLMVFVLLHGPVYPLHAQPQPQPNTEQKEPALRLGVVPFLSAPALLRVHRPLREFMERRLGREVMVHTSHNHEQFLISMIEGRFDVIVIPVHFLALAVDNGFVPLLRYRKPFEVLVFVRNDSHVKTVEDLRDKYMGVPEKMSLYYVVGIQWLSEFYPGKKLLLRVQPSHMAGMMAVNEGRIDAMVTARQSWLMLNKRVREQLRSIKVEYPLLPSLTTLARRDLGPVEIGRIRAALEDFARSTEGQKFMEDSDYGGYVPVTEADVKYSRSYVKIIEQMKDDSQFNE